MLRRWLAGAVRRAAPHWVKNTLDAALIDYERWAPPRVLRQPPGQRVLVLAPHPDDESIACGGTLALYAAAGTPLHVAFLTDGRLGDPVLRAMPEGTAERTAAEDALAVRRRGEADAALAVLGIADASFLGAPDGALAAAVPRLAPVLAQLIAEHRPDTVLLPFFGDRHADHFAANRCLLAATALLGGGAADGIECLGYEAWSPLYANLVVDVAPVYATKLRAIACHASQTAHDDYIAGVEGLNRFRAVSSMSGATHAEAFFAAPLATYRRLCERLLA